VAALDFLWAKAGGNWTRRRRFFRFWSRRLALR